MTLLNRAGIALAVLATSLVCAGQASAQVANPPCDTLTPGIPIVYGIGGSAQGPLFKALGQAFAKSSDPITIVYASPGACFAMQAFDPNAAKPYYLPETAAYTLADGVQKACTVPANTPADFGSMQIDATSCQDVDKLYAGVGDFTGPYGTVNFFVANKSTQSSISSEAAHFIYGFGKDSGVKPWIKEDLLIVRNPSSAVHVYVALAAGLPVTALKGKDAGSNPESIRLVAQATDKQAAIGFASGENVDANRKVVKNLAYQHEGQTCGYWPDSTQSSFDKKNVRTGQYYLWGKTHLFAKIDGDKKVINENVARLISYFSGAEPAPEDIPLLDIFIDNGNIPECAMQVSRDHDLGPIYSYQPDEPCGCYFDARVTGSSECDECPGGDDDECPRSAPKCRHGYCEVK